MSKFQELSGLIWNVADDVLRGLFKPHEYGDVILPFVILRRLDCVIEPRKDEIYNLYEEYKSKVEEPSPIIKNRFKTEFYNTSKYDLSRLKQDPKNIYINFQNYINGYSKNVYDIIENFQLDKPVEKLHKNNRLFLLIEKFTTVDLHPQVVDNHTMGQVYEELLRRFSELSNETSGEHYTPRDIVRLLVSLVFIENKEDLQGEGKIRSLFDPCSGTGGMLTIGKEWVLENINPNIDIIIYGQELNPQTYSVCKSDLLISGENPDNIKLGSSLSNDGFTGEKFDYQITNPPFGVSWKGDQEFVVSESENPNGRFFVGLPRISDGTLLFLSHMISKMEEKGGRIGIISNRSPLMTGDAESGESEIRKWIIENDLLECIVSLPENLFFNTQQPTFIWILNNKKKTFRKNKIQLINGVGLYKPLKKNLNKKNCYIDEESRNKIIDSYIYFKENDISLIFNNSSFGYKKVTIKVPLIENGEICYEKNGKMKINNDQTYTENLLLTEDEEEYLKKWVLKKSPHSFIDKDLTKIGYEIIFHKYFIGFVELKKTVDLQREIKDRVSSLNDSINRIEDVEYGDFDDYQNSNVFKKVPSSWEILKIRDVLEQRKEISVSGEEELLSVSEYKGIIPRREIVEDEDNLSRSETLEGYKKCYKGDLVNNIMLMWKRGLGFSEYDGIVSPAYSVFQRKNLEDNYRYYNYLLRTEYYRIIFKRNSKGVIDSRLRLYDDDFLQLFTVRPSIDEQKEISKFLDDQIQNLDSIKEKLKSLIEVFETYKISLIEESVFMKKQTNQ